MLRQHRLGGSVRPFEPFGYDERQYGSCGFNLPVGRLTRTPNGEYPEYHTSADDLELVRPEQLSESLEFVLDILEILETNCSFQNTHPYCEPPLSKHGLYEAYGSVDPRRDEFQRAVQWVLNLSDGRHTLLDIAQRSAMEYGRIKEAARQLVKCGLLKEA